jgi:hypothetical protein
MGDLQMALFVFALLLMFAALELSNCFSGDRALVDDSFLAIMPPGVPLTPLRLDF